MIKTTLFSNLKKKDFPENILFTINIMEKNLIGWFFGKKKSKRSKKTKRSAKASKKQTKPSKKLIRMAKKYGVRVTVKRGSKRVWKSSKMIMKQIRRAKKMMRSIRSKKTSRKLSRFGTVGGRYMPLSGILSPYPRAVTSGSPFI